MAKRYNRKYDPKYCEEVVEWMSKGMSFDSFAGKLLVTRQTIYNWTEAYPEFARAKEVAFEASRVFWEQAGIQGMLVGDKLKFNATVWVFNMKNRFGWQDRHEIQHELGENAQKLMISVQEAKQLVSADPIDVNVIDVSSEE